MTRILALAAMMSVALIARAQAPNQLANSGFEDGASGWKFPQIANFEVSNDASHGGSRSLRISNTDAAAYLLASQKISVEPGRRYRFGAWIKTRDVKGEDTGATICMEWTGPAGVIGGSYLDGRKGDQDWFHLEGLSGPIPDGAVSGLVTLYLRHGMTGTAWFDDVSVTEEYAPALDAALLQPNYRGRLIAGQHVLVRARVGDHLKGGVKPESTRLVLSIFSGERILNSRTFSSPTPGVNDLALDPGPIDPVRFDSPLQKPGVRVALLTAAGEELASQAFELNRPAPEASPPTVYIDEHNRTLVGGRPFFPLGWYFGPAPTDSNFRQHIDRVAASPFNTIMCYGISGGTIADVRSYLDYLASRNVKLIYSLKDVYAGTNWFQKSMLGWTGEDSIVTGVVQTFRDHPAILAWYLNDELPLTMRERLEARQRRVHELDANHPTWVVLNQVSDLPGYLNTSDVLGTDPYPVPDSSVTMAGEWTQISNDVSGGLRPIWMVPQAFDKANYRKPPQSGRAPTLGEELVMSYLCLIHGANGLIYYSYFDLERDRIGFNNRWADMLVVGREVQQLEPALLSIAKPPNVTVTPGGAAVQWAVRADDRGNTYVLLA
ncbi:MAG: carbohydrate binding domain-containing protein, partial [Candidatus Eiseniibacteriota bacterium]